MRIDAFLKTARLIKRRTIAKEACDQGRVELNGRPAKAGSSVKVGDVIQIRFGSHRLVVKVAKIAEHCRKEDAQTLYEVVASEPAATHPPEGGDQALLFED